MFSNKNTPHIYIGIFSAIFIVGAVVMAIICSQWFFKLGYAHTRAEIAGQSFVLAVAHTPAQRQLGLSYVRHMPVRAGMLFIFEDEGQHPFWMKDMRFPLDILWVDSDFRVVHIEKSLDPTTYPTTFDALVPSQYVIEVTAGTAEKFHVENGDEISFPAYIAKR